MLLCRAAVPGCPPREPGELWPQELLVGLLASFHLGAPLHQVPTPGILGPGENFSGSFFRLKIRRVDKK
jgi:hypothetical protein